jgi:hypothetical protein
MLAPQAQSSAALGLQLIFFKKQQFLAREMKCPTGAIGRCSKLRVLNEAVLIAPKQSLNRALIDP